VIGVRGNRGGMTIGLRTILLFAAAVLFAIQAFGRNDSDVDFLAAGLALMAIALAVGDRSIGGRGRGRLL
jgi:hypothetical protein